MREAKTREGGSCKDITQPKSSLRQPGKRFGCWFCKQWTSTNRPCHSLPTSMSLLKIQALSESLRYGVGVSGRQVWSSWPWPWGDRWSWSSLSHRRWFSRGFFCRHHVRLAHACNRHWATATKHIQTASWTSTRHPKVKSYLHAWEKTGGDADGPNKPLQETKYTW